MVVGTATLTFALAATTAFAPGATATVGAMRLSLRYRGGIAATLAIGGATAVLAALLWLDGRVHRYVGLPFWAVVALVPAVGGVGATGSRRWNTIATAAWIGAFALALRVRLGRSADVGSAAAVGLVIEAFVAAAFVFPGALLGAAITALARKHLPYTEQD